MKDGWSAISKTSEPASFCTWLVSSVPWYVEPAIASGSFVAWLLFFRTCELGRDFLISKAPREPYRLVVSLVSRARQWLRQWLRQWHRRVGVKGAYPIGPAGPSGRRELSPDCMAPAEERARTNDADPIKPPHDFTTQTFGSLGAYWGFILLWSRLVAPVTGAGTGCPTGAASTGQLVAEVAAGLVAYDFVFFWLHVGMHLLPRIGRAVGHSKHHDFDGKHGGGAASESAF